MRAVLLAAMLALGAAAPALAARPGTVDRSFGDDGRVETQVPGGRPAVAGVKALVGGRPRLVGTVGTRRVVLIQYHRAGLVDRRFGERGVATLRFPEGVFLGAVTFLRSGNVHDGRVVIGGRLGPEDGPGSEAFIARLESDGTLDPSFGDEGIVRVGVGDTVMDVAVRGDGAVIATVVGSDDIVVARYDSRGVPDPSFGQGGVVQIAAGPLEHLAATAVALQGDRILVAGTHARPRRSVPFVLGLLPDGSPDPAFGRNGRVRLPGDGTTVNELVVEPGTGRPLLAGTASRRRASIYYAELARDGGPPAVRHVAVRNRFLFGQSLLLDGAGRRVLGGSVIAPRSGHTVFGVARLLPDGRRDRCFGLARVGFGAPTTLGAVDLDGRGRIVAAGSGARAFRLTRLWGGPRPGSSPRRTPCRSPRPSSAR